MIGEITVEVFIQPLDQHTLPQAVILRNHIFPKLGKLEHDTLSASLTPLKYHVHKKLGIKQLEYWVAIHPGTREVVGLVGLYTQTDDNDGMIWLGWYCVDSDHRGLKIGKKLIGHAIEHAKEQKKKILHLYTTSGDEYATARELYHNIGFKHYKSKSSELYYRLIL